MNGAEFQTSFTFLLSILLTSYAVDTIFPNQPISNGFIDSSGGTFRMGFFTPDNSQYRFLGIWYRTIPVQTIVWVANRDSPFNSSVFLQLSHNGTLQILFNTTVLWSSGVNQTIRNPVAQLLESGNLVLREETDDNPENYSWQSFDHPTDTALPGMKIGRDFRTGVDRVLRSWTSRNDPSTGNWSFFLETSGFPAVVLFYDGIKRFSSGPWNGERFSGSTGLRPNLVYTYEFVLNQEETYYSFHLINSSVFSMLVLNPQGVLQRLTWNYRTQVWTTLVNVPADNCDSYSICHGYGTCDLNRAPVCSCLDRFRPRDSRGWAATDWSNGCERRTALNCSTDGFVKYSGLKLPDTANSWYNQSMSIRECERMCLRNCSCMAYSNTNITGRGSGCLLWFDELVDIKNLRESGQDIFIRMARSELGSRGKNILILKVCLSLVACILLLALVFILYRRKKKKQKMKNAEHLNQEMTREVSFGNPTRPSNALERKRDPDLPVFELSTILKATNYFSPQNKIGKGGFGCVYKGTLEEGLEIAVKRLSKNSIQGIDEFKNEVILIKKLQHRNLVKLLGCCIEEEEKMLVYEFMPNKSLDAFIFDKNQSKMLDWPTRFCIINGIARGLMYLHQDSRLRIIHRDLKAGNILLDNEMNPKISDFGMARIFGGQETEANTGRIVGTYGYMSPEYAVDGNFSVKSDVFSFGVLVLEIISGCKNRGFIHSDHHHNLIGHAWILHNEGRSLESIDANLCESCHINEILRTIHVALLCVQTNPEDRPGMSNVVLMLGSEGDLSMPKEPGFFTERNLFHEAADFSSSKLGASSVNEYNSITIVEGR